MESMRQQKIARLIQKDIGDIFSREGSHLSGGAMITVTKVNVTSDLSLARINLSIFAPAGKDGIIDVINSKKKEIRYKLGVKVRNQLRKVPDLEFFEDDSLDYIENIENLLNT